MEVINDSYEIVSITPNVLNIIEKAARICYKSKSDGEKKRNVLIKSLIKSGHEAMIEFGDIHVVFEVDRGISHELVRHRLCSFAQESSRYVNYNKKGGIRLIKPPWYSDNILGCYDKIEDIKGSFTDNEIIWLKSMLVAEQSYNYLTDNGEKAQQSRGVLPNALATKINMKGNLREWRHIFNLRCSSKAHPQISSIMKRLLFDISTKIPIIFDDIVTKYS